MPAKRHPNGSESFLQTRASLTRKRFAAVAILAYVALYEIGEARAFSCPPRPAPQINSANDYAMSLVDTLALLRAARDSSKDVDNPTPSMKSITVLKTAGQQYDCARANLTPYAKSKNNSVSESARLMLAGTATLRSVNDIFLQRYQAALDGKSGSRSAPEETSAQLTKLASDASTLAPYAANAACLALIESDHNEQQRLTLTARERATLIKAIEKNFQRRPGKPAEAILPLENSALLLLDFLKDTTRKSRDDR